MVPGARAIASSAFNRISNQQTLSSFSLSRPFSALYISTELSSRITLYCPFPPISFYICINIFNAKVLSISLTRKRKIGRGRKKTSLTPSMLPSFSHSCRQISFNVSPYSRVRSSKCKKNCTIAAARELSMLSISISFLVPSSIFRSSKNGYKSVEERLRDVGRAIPTLSEL